MAATADTPSQAVLAAVAEREGVSRLELETPLFEAIDPDALNSLFRDTRVQVTFEYAGYIVTLDESGDVELDALPEADR